MDGEGWLSAVGAARALWSVVCQWCVGALR